MKILKIFGVVVGIHVFALFLIFANPGCSSTTKPTPVPTDTMIRSDPAPLVTLPSGSTAVSVPTGDRSPVSPPPIAFNPDAPATAGGSGVRFVPTRPGTPAASVLVAEPVADVTPATAYVVANGDSIWSVSKKFHVTTTDIVAANGLKSGAVIRPGQRLVIPAKSVSPAAGTAKPAEAAAAKASSDTVRHVVRSGETLSTIARQYDVKQSDIAVANNISDPQKIRAGMELTIPGWQTPGGKSSRSTPKSANNTATKAAPAKAGGVKSIFSVEPGPTSTSKPAAGAEVPVIRVDESPITPAPGKP